MARAVILMMDSFGVGYADDAASFGDEGSNTLGHIVEQTKVQLPNLARLGLEALATEARGPLAHSLGHNGELQGAYGYAQEISFGKDTPSGHWEIAGVPVTYDWGYFKELQNTFPEKLLKDFIAQTSVPGVLGNCHASGTVILDELGAEHIESGKPIVYTSADSVFQIAAHEKYFGLERLYTICEIARKLVDEYEVGRVIARPFVGEVGSFQRTANRRDYATPPHDKTLLEHLCDAGGSVISVGKIADIYAHQGITTKIKAEDNDGLFSATVEALKTCPDQGLVFTNFVDFDSKFGHRRNVQGYADALAAFDKRLPEIEALLQPDDLLMITADHGCDPTWQGTDHTREFVPVIFAGPKVAAQNLGKRPTFADMGQTLARHFSLEPLTHGTALL